MFARWVAAMAVTAAFAVALGFAVPSAHADAVAEFYKGKQINLLVGYGPGGGYDIYARLLARHLGKFIPGNPSVVVQNMPGAGSLRAVNYLYNIAPKDGTAIGTFSRNMPLIGHARRQRQRAIQSAQAHLARLLVELRQRRLYPDRAQGRAGEIDRGGAPPGSARRSFSAAPPKAPPATTCRSSCATPSASTSSRSWAIRTAPRSFSRSSAARSHGRTVDLSSVRSVKPEWLKPDSAYRVLVQFARTTRHPDFPDVPTARELAQERGGARADRARRAALCAVAAVRRAARTCRRIAPRRCSAAFLGVHGDPHYLEEAAKLRIDVSPIGGDGVAQAIERIASAPPELLDYVRKLLAETKGGG